jgi:hypothetical protein
MVAFVARMQTAPDGHGVAACALGAAMASAPAATENPATVIAILRRLSFPSFWRSRSGYLADRVGELELLTRHRVDHDQAK